MSDILSDVAKKIGDNDDLPLSVSAVVTANSIGYPRRVVEPEGETHEGEHKNFDEAYDYAKDIFGVDDLDIEKDEQYVWFTNPQSE